MRLDYTGFPCLPDPPPTLCPNPQTKQNKNHKVQFVSFKFSLEHGQTPIGKFLKENSVRFLTYTPPPYSHTIRSH